MPPPPPWPTTTTGRSRTLRVTAAERYRYRRRRRARIVPVECRRRRRRRRRRRYFKRLSCVSFVRSRAVSRVPAVSRFISFSVFFSARAIVVVAVRRGHAASRVDLSPAHPFSRVSSPSSSSPAARVENPIRGQRRKRRSKARANETVPRFHYAKPQQQQQQQRQRQRRRRQQLRRGREFLRSDFYAHVACRYRVIDRFSRVRPPYAVTPVISVGSARGRRFPSAAMTNRVFDPSDFRFETPATR